VKSQKSLIFEYIKKLNLPMKVIIFTIVFLISILPVVLANTPPELKEGSAQPSIAISGDSIIYHVGYIDKDGDAPEYVRIYFTNRYIKEMKKISGDYITGAIYEYKWDNQDDGYDYRFEASDGKTVVKFPVYGGTLAPVNFLSEKLSNNKIYLFSRQSSKPIWSYTTGKDWVNDVAISDDGKYIAVQAGNSIYLFSKENAIPLWIYECHSGSEHLGGGWLIDISSDGKYIVGGCQNSLHLFSKEANQPLWSYEGNANIYAVSISADGKYIAAGTSNTDELIFFSRDSNKPLWKYQATADIHGLALPNNGNLIAAGSHSPEERAYLFSKDNNNPLTAYKTSPESPVWTAAMSRDGKYSVYGLDSSDTYNSIFLFSTDKDTPLKTWITDWWVRSVDISSDGKYITAGSGDHNVYLFDRDKNEPLWKFKADERIGSVAISKDGKYITAGSKDKNIYLFFRESNTPLWNYKTDFWVTAVAISADSNYIVSGTGASQYLSEGHHPIYNPEKRLKKEISKTDKETNTIIKETICGNGICEGVETYKSCPNDCCGEDCNFVEDFSEERNADKKESTKPEKEKDLFSIIIDFLRRLFIK